MQHPPRILTYALALLITSLVLLITPPSLLSGDGNGLIDMGAYTIAPHQKVTRYSWHPDDHTVGELLQEQWLTHTPC